MYVTDLRSGVYDEIKRTALRATRHAQGSCAAEASMSGRYRTSPTTLRSGRRFSRRCVRPVSSRCSGSSSETEMTMLGAGLEYSHAEQRWYRDLYSGRVPLAPGPLQYLHYDEGDCLPKSMIYLTPVGEDGGPTRAIPGSNRWESVPVQDPHVPGTRSHHRRSVQPIDREEGDYRVLARRPELRRIFMELPRAVPGRAISATTPAGFGAGLDAEIARDALSERGWSDHGLRRTPSPASRQPGSKSGERLSLQVVYRNRNEARIRSELARQTLLSEQAALLRKYARRFVMEHA